MRRNLIITIKSALNHAETSGQHLGTCSLRRRCAALAGHLVA
jgi:hypothetical protein